MKKVFKLLLTIIFLSNTALAANTATDMYQVPIRVHGEGPVHMVKAVIDTTNTDLTLFDPASEKYACIVGIYAVDGTAANLTLKSASTTVALLEMAANGQVNNVRVPLCAAKGADLIMQSSAAYTNLLFMLIEASKMAVE